MIILMGPQGSGKGTQAQILASVFKAKHLSTGEMLRSSTDPKVHAKLERGELFDDEDMTMVLKESLGKLSSDSKIILDGYPRNMNQVKLLDELLVQRGEQVESVIYITLSDEEALKRMLKRGRADDTEAAISQRLKQYKEETMPVLEHFIKAGIMHEIDGLGSIEEVTNRIEKVVPWHS